MDFSIRPARTDDAESIVELLNPIILAGAYTIMDEPVSVAEQIEFIRGLPAGSVYNLAVCNESGRIIGMQDVMPASTTGAQMHVGEISTFVSLESLRNGVGRSLTVATMKQARQNRFQRILATIRADNAPAVAFYQSQGFEIIGTAHRHAFASGKYVDSILTECWIR